MNRTWQKNGWRPWHFVAAALMVTAAIAVTYATWAELVYIAGNDAEASHLLLVPLVAPWLLWVRRGRLRNCRPGGGWVGVAILLGGAFLCYYGFDRGYSALWYLGAIMTVVGALISVIGRDILVKFLPVFFVLLFLVPVPQRIRKPIADKLQRWSAIITYEVLDTCGVDVERSENLLTVNGTPVSIAEACNGMRGVFALVLVAYAFIFGNPLRSYVRVLLLIFAPILALICNVIRLVPTVYFFSTLPRDSAEQVHNYGGWAMLIVAFLLLMAVIRVLRWALVPVEQFTLAYD